VRIDVLYGDVLLRRLFVEETFCRGDVLSRRRFVEETFCMCALESTIQMGTGTSTITRLSHLF
jgi:hypothetical protein